MNKKILKELISESYTRNELDPIKVMRIADILSRSELKQYIQALKDTENNMSVTVTIPDGMEDLELEQFKDIFQNKKICIEKDPSLLLGVKITDNDMVYEFNLRNTLEKMVKYVEESYD
jgi:F0F1-type ATP synthase delta subunit